MSELLRLANLKRLTPKDLESSVLADVFQQIKLSLGISKPRQILSHAISGLGSIPKCPCGSTLSWSDDHRRYRVYCSNACTATYSVAAKKEKNKELYGVEWHSQRADWLSKMRSTSLKKYGTEHYSKTPEHKERTKKSNQRKFNVDYPAQSPQIQVKMKNTCTERYGVDNPAKVQEIADRIKGTCLEKYGVSNPAQKNYSPEAIHFLEDDEFFKTELDSFSVIDLSKKYDISVKPIYDKVNFLGIKLTHRVSSSFEVEVTAFISSLYPDEVLTNDWTILKDKQLDILLPKLSLAFECNGTYWHTELLGRGNKYHLSKTARCRENNITLVHIWEHDWYQKNDIMKSMIASRVNHVSVKIPARKTQIKEISQPDAAVFFKNNHLQGRTYQAAVNLGLYFAGELVSVMSFGSNRFTSKYQWELLRFANKINTTVVGGASKLFKNFLEHHSPESIVSFSDKMHSTGKMYAILGFTHMGTSKPGYKYTKNYTDVFNRQKFQKHKLKKSLPIFDSSLSEAANMLNNGYTRLWDCGHDVFVWSKVPNITQGK
jgi:hypothetical protein